MKLDKFTAAYIEAALWSSTDDDDCPLDDSYSADDLAPETLDRMIANCRKFQDENAELFSEQNYLGRRPVDTHRDYLNYPTAIAGHDFWLTRNGHGAGFWDGDWDTGDALTAAAKAFGECELYVGDDGLIYSTDG